MTHAWDLVFIGADLVEANAPHTMKYRVSTIQYNGLVLIVRRTTYMQWRRGPQHRRLIHGVDRW